MLIAPIVNDLSGGRQAAGSHIETCFANVFISAIAFYNNETHRSPTHVIMSLKSR